MAKFEVNLPGSHLVKIFWEIDPKRSSPTQFITRSGYSDIIKALAVKKYVHELTMRKQSNGYYEHFLSAPLDYLASYYT